MKHVHVGHTKLQRPQAIHLLVYSSQTFELNTLPDKFSGIFTLTLLLSTYFGVTSQVTFPSFSIKAASSSHLQSKYV